jgi:hypothetical protein
MQKYLSKAKGESLKETMLKEYRQFIHWLGNYDLTANEIKEKDPEILEEIHKAIEEMDNHFLNENLQGFNNAMEQVKKGYLQAMAEVNN